MPTLLVFFFRTNTKNHQRNMTMFVFKFNNKRFSNKSNTFFRFSMTDFDPGVEDAFHTRYDNSDPKSFSLSTHERVIIIISYLQERMQSRILYLALLNDWHRHTLGIHKPLQLAINTYIAILLQTLQTSKIMLHSQKYSVAVLCYLIFALLIALYVFIFYFSYRLLNFYNHLSLPYLVIVLISRWRISKIKVALVLRDPLTGRLAYIYYAIYLFTFFLYNYIHLYMW